MAVEKALSLKQVNEGYSGFVLILSGDASERARDELNQRGVKIYERQLPGPLQ
jgi:hypothetical protein